MEMLKWPSISETILSLTFFRSSVAHESQIVEAYRYGAAWFSRMALREQERIRAGGGPGGWLDRVQSPLHPRRTRTD